MRRIDELKDELKAAIQESDEYRNFKKLEAEINQNPELKRAVDELRKENFELQYTSNMDDILARTDKISSQFAEVRMQDKVNKYLLSEICLCRLVQDICMSVVEAVDFDMDFLLD